MKKRSLNPRDSVYNAIRPRPARHSRQAFHASRRLDGIRNRVGILATLKLQEAHGGSIKEDSDHRGRQILLPDPSILSCSSGVR
jgi:hypothetical protein